MDATDHTLEILSGVRAYVVKDYDEDRAEVVFARSEGEAREYASTEFEVNLVERAEEFDAFYGDIEALRKAQLALGWWFTCGYCNCESQVSDDPDEEYDAETGHVISHDCPVVIGADVYCNGWCAGAEAARHVERRALKWAALEAFVEKFPGAEVDEVWMLGVKGPSVWFYVDECRPSRLSWTFGESTIELPLDLIQAWERYDERRQLLRGVSC